MKKFLIAAILAFSWAAPACAIGAIADITIYDRAENRALPVYAHEGRYYVVGRPGNEYQVNVRNNQAGDILTVATGTGTAARYQVLSVGPGGSGGRGPGRCGPYR